MRIRPMLFSALLVFTTPVFAKDVYLSITGTVNNFRTDVRIFNPSSTKDISIQAAFLPVGNGANSSPQTATITVPKRQMKILDDVVSTLFNITGLGAIRLSCADDFVATSRIYAVVTNGTLGQFVPGLDSTQAKNKGVLIQLKSSTAFRTNIGAVNPNDATATVTWRLYDKANNLVATGAPIAMPPFAVIGPTNMGGTFFFNPGTADLSDAWVSYSSDQPLFAYASIIDSATSDPTFVPASEDTGTSAPAAKIFDVHEQSFAITITPTPSLKVGDHVTFRFTGQDTTHGFELVDPNGGLLIEPMQVPPNSPVIEKSFVVNLQGTYSYFCTIPTCGFGHSNMFGNFQVGKDDGGGGPIY